MPKRLGTAAIHDSDSRPTAGFVHRPILTMVSSVHEDAAVPKQKQREFDFSEFLVHSRCTWDVLASSYPPLSFRLSSKLKLFSGELSECSFPSSAIGWW